jgi:peptidoglycan/LPS O-acetylase OafA/YrhL
MTATPAELAPAGAEFERTATHAHPAHRAQADVALHGHMPALDGIRGIAILMVMAFHFTLSSVDDGPVGHVANKLMLFGQQGVDLFFVLSGFLITGILIDAKGKSHYFRNFYARRTLRIFPLYYFVLALVLVVIPIFVTYTNPQLVLPRKHQIWMWTYLTNFLMARSTADVGAFSIFWSLAIEEHFYLLWPLLVFCLSRRALMRLCGVLMAGALLCRFFFMFRGDPWSVAAAATLTFCRIDTLAAGALVALACRGPGGIAAVRPSARIMAIGGGIGLVAVIVQRFARGIETNDFITRTAGFTFVAFFFAGLIVLAVGLPRHRRIARLVAAAPLRFFGRYSYGLYVYHAVLITLVLTYWPLAQNIRAAGHNSPVSVLAGWFAQFALLIAVCTAVAYASYHLFEKHFLRLKRYFER